MSLGKDKNIYHLKFTICQRGARNSFTEIPISPYVIGETQKPHLNQDGKDAVLDKTPLLSNLVVFY